MAIHCGACGIRLDSGAENYGSFEVDASFNQECRS